MHIVMLFRRVTASIAQLVVGRTLKRRQNLGSKVDPRVGLFCTCFFLVRNSQCHTRLEVDGIVPPCHGIAFFQFKFQKSYTFHYIYHINKKLFLTVCNLLKSLSLFLSYISAFGLRLTSAALNLECSVASCNFFTLLIILLCKCPLFWLMSIFYQP